LPLPQSNHPFLEALINMTQTEFSELSNQVIQALDADPFGAEFAALDQRYNQALDELFNEARLAALEAAYEASQDYRHTCTFASF
jgi:hypothetical protein